MQNLNNNSTKAAELVEIIPEQRNKIETAYFVLAVFIILGVAAVCLPLVQQTRAALVKPPKALAHVITQLSNAQVELEMLVESELTSNQPSLAELVELEIAPFSNLDFEQLKPGCFVLKHQDANLRFKQNSQGQWQTSWQEIDSHGHHDHEQAHYCSDSPNWLHVSNLPNH